MENTFDLVVIGSGPGGYVAAIQGAKRGFKVACIERESSLGGTCLNVGCIPSKALLHSTEYYERIALHGSEHGIYFNELRVNLDEMMLRKKNVVAKLAGGVEFLFKKNKITLFKGHATFRSNTQVEVNEEIISAKYILIATGSEPISLPFLPFDEKIVLSSTGALSLPKVPNKMLMVGAGVIGLELGSVYRRLGAEIEVVELLDQIIASFDRDISEAMLLILQKQKMKFHLKSKILDGKVHEKGVELFIEGQEKPLKGDVVLVGVGRRPYTHNLGLENVGIELDKQGRIVINSAFCTSVPNIFAIGDVVDGPMLAHKAQEEGVAVVDYLAGIHKPINYLFIPNVMYTWPEVASVGMGEKEANEAGLDLLIGKVSFKGIPRAKCSGDEEGFVKILGEKKSDRIIGMQIIGPNASEMIHEGVIALEQQMTLEHLGRASHAHPTCSEAIKEAALAAKGEAIHF